ncbi:MAG: DUF5995 family protein [Acidobacteriota bacterium]
MSVQTIDQVLARLTTIVHDSLEQSARIGYFAGLYLRVTWSVKRAIVAGNVFQDNERMEQLDVTFASRFLDAWGTWNAGGQPTSPWALAFEDLARDDLMVVQHMALAMNAHIDLDLGVATEQVMRERGEPLDDIHTDFDMINTILHRLIGIVQVQLAEISPTFKKIERLAPGIENHLFGKVMDALRDGAWELAERLDQKKHDAGRSLVIKEREALTTAAGKLIQEAGDVPLFGSLIDKVVAEENANGIPFNIQVVAE